LWKWGGVGGTVAYLYSRVRYRLRSVINQV